MSRRGVSAPLAVQMENLKKSMSSRDQRRNQERMQRVVRSSSCPSTSNPCYLYEIYNSIEPTKSKLLISVQEQAGVDIYEKKNQPSNATGGVQLGPESAAFAAVQRAAALAGPSMIHCDLCNVRLALTQASSSTPCQSNTSASAGQHMHIGVWSIAHQCINTLLL